MISHAIQYSDTLLIGGQPTPAQLEELAAAGYKHIINVRSAAEMAGSDEPAQVEALGMVYTHISVAGGAGLTDENVRLFDEALGRIEGPIVVHCATGNRVGALFALRAKSLEGASTQDAMELGFATGMVGLAPIVSSMLGA